MKNIYILIFFLFSSGVFAQNIGRINSHLKLSDSLTYEAEIRIYHSAGISNYSSLFRMYKDKSEKWTAEFHEHYAKVAGQAKLLVKKQILKPKNNMDFIFSNFVRSHILNLPSINEIQWKLITRGDIKKIKRKHRGKTIEKYQLMNKQISIIDGDGFKVQVKSWNKTNKFEFNNPDAYLRRYPEIDELVYMCEILALIRAEFSIWKK